ncbi:hypothetical protein B484DRAFT_461912, partial [Ochromonadaceae sp. CCMP2298]
MIYNKFTHNKKVQDAAAAGQSERKSRALANQQDELTTVVLLKSGASAIDHFSKKAMMVQRFRNAGAWSLFDDATEPPSVPPSSGGTPGPTTRENAFNDTQAINFDGDGATRITAMRTAAQINAGMIWTAADQRKAQLDVEAHRTRALLDVDLQLDAITQQFYDREQVRLAKSGRFKSKQKAAGSILFEMLSTELLQPYMDAINENRFRWVWREIGRNFDGTVGGIDNSINLLDKIGAYVYCCEHDFEDNLTYVNRLGSMVNYADDYKMVVLVRGIERSKIHIEMKTVARLHKHLPTSTYDILVLALRTT